MEERSGEAFELDARLTVVGSKLQVGQNAPDFALEHNDPTSGAMQTVTLEETAGKVRLLNLPPAT